jgi:hypothetical protein
MWDLLEMNSINLTGKYVMISTDSVYDASQMTLAKGCYDEVELIKEEMGFLKEDLDAETLKKL